MKFQSLHKLESVEIPDDDIGLESHVCLLTRCQVFSRRGSSNNGDVVVVTLYEILESVTLPSKTAKSLK